MTPDEYVVDIKNRFGEQMTKDGLLVRDMEERELLKRMLSRYPGDKDKILGLETYLGEVPEGLPKSQVQEELEKKTGYLARVAENMRRSTDLVGQTFKDSAEDVVESFSKVGEEDGLGRKLLRVGTAAGDTVGEVAQAAGGIAMGAGKALLSPFSQIETAEGTTVGEEIAEPIKEKLSGALDYIKNEQPDIYKFFTENEVGKQIGNLLEVSALKGAPGAKVPPVKEMVGAVGADIKAAVPATINAAKTAVTAPLQLPVSAAKGAYSKTKSWMQEPIKASVETVLKETPVQTFDNYVDIAKKATINNKNQTPLEFAGTQAQRALDQMNRKLSTIGKNKSGVLEGAAGRTPVGNIVVKFRQQLINRLKDKTSVEGDTKLYRDVLEQAKQLGDNPTALQVDKFIDFVQDRIYTGKRDLSLPVTDEVQATLRPLTGQLNSALKAKLPESYRTLNERYAELVGTRNELNIKLGFDGEKGGSLMKRVFSPSDANTKKLFADVLDETGIDLVNEATLARYIMDILGDARQKSMLEQLQLTSTKPSAAGIVSRGWDKLIEMANSPEELIRRARALTNDASTPKP